MAIFQKSVLNKFIKSQDSSKIDTAYQKFSEIFLQADRQAEIRSMKEEEYQDGFLDDLFVNVLGYIKRPNTGYNLVREKKNEADSKKADGAILKNDLPLAVIELKGTDTTDLDKVTEQGFGYKNNHKECVYVVTSNFEKLRFFIHNAVEFIEFNLFVLSKEDFITLWLCLHADNLLDNIPAKIKSESVVKEEDITKNLYKDYSSFKQELWQNIVALNPNGDPLMFYKKTQKLIDRFLFIFFAEDAGLLPPNSISRMVDRWKMLKDEDAYKPLYDIFKQYFGYINTGRPGKTPQDEIFAYNGGLMLEDDVLESINIDDDILLKHVTKLTSYDFSSEVDVNILGHIFENSLNDIEAVTAELEGHEIDKSKTKRKKDGVFYTPKYITKYIVENTVGKLCQEKKTELNIIDEEYAKGRTHHKKENLKKLDQNLQDYRNWLLQITICDPACGSGAFLNQALEFLMEEHQYIDELESKLLGSGFKFPGVENHILENNIFGVDINEESVEIAKLSLWLRTAQRGRKLTSLNNNIKCGNSLIDDINIAGNKAFNWQEEFPSVFDKGGFDVVIGNPPYVLCQPSNTSDEILQYYKQSKVACYKIDLFHLFFEKSIYLLKNNGNLGFITPNTYLTNKYIEPLRNFILTNSTIQSLVSYQDAVFPDASVDVATIILKKENKQNSKIEIFESNSGVIHYKSTKPQSDWMLDVNKTFNLKSDFTFNNDDVVRLGELCNTYFGIQAFDRKTSISDTKIDDNYLELIDGGDIHPYIYASPKKFFNYRNELIKSGGDWTVYNQERIVIRQIGQFPIVGMCEKGILCSNTLYSVYPKNNEINLKYLLCILNSSFMKKYWISKYSDGKQLFPKIKGYQIKELPIVLTDEFNQKEISDLASLMITQSEELISLDSKFVSFVKNKFPDLESKLSSWFQFSFNDLLKVLKKSKVRLNLSEEAEWMQYFNDQIINARKIQLKISQINQQIDCKINELYGITNEEIQIVEKS